MANATMTTTKNTAALARVADGAAAFFCVAIAGGAESLVTRAPRSEGAGRLSGFFAFPCCAEQRVSGGHELVHADGFGQVFVHADAAGVGLVAFSFVGRDHDD